MNNKKDRRLTIRLDPQDSREKSIISHLDSLDKRKHRSVNSFVIDALEHYIAFLSGGNNRLLEDIRQIFREEVHVPSVQQPIQTKKWDPQLSEEESKENDQNVLDVLDEMFG